MEAVAIGKNLSELVSYSVMRTHLTASIMTTHDYTTEDIREVLDLVAGLVSGNTGDLTEDEIKDKIYEILS